MNVENNMTGHDDVVLKDGWIDLFSQSSPPGAVLLYIVQKYVAGIATGRRRRLGTNRSFNNK